jgi:hypothetical protein
VVTLALWTNTTQSSSWLYQGGLAGYALMSCLFIVAAVRKGPVRSLLSMRWLCALGAISYGVYLFHWPIYLWLTPRRTGLDPWPLFALRLGVTLVLAIVSARLIEMPIRRRRFPVRVNPLALSGACAALIVVSLFAVTAAPLPGVINLAKPTLGPLPSLETTTTVQSVSTNVGGIVTAPMIPKVALEPGEAPRALLFGDSTMLTLGDGLVHWGPNTGRLQVWDGGSLGCPVGRFGAYEALGKVIQVYSDCDWTHNLAREVTQIRPHVVMVMFGPWDVANRLRRGDTQWRSIGDPVYDKWLRGEISALIETITSRGSSVVWLMEPHIRVGITEGLKGPFPEEDPIRMDRFNQLVREVVAVEPRATVLDLEAEMRSLPEGEMSLADRPDGVHWSAPAAYALAPWLGGSLINVAHGQAALPIGSRG